MKGFIEQSIKGQKRKQYQTWIDDNVGIKCQGLCKKKAEAMATAFSNLEVVGIVGAWTSHAWCIDKKGRVVDPTAHQFEHGFRYPSNFLRKADFPVGKCLYCGELIWPDTENARLHSIDGVGPHEECNALLYMEYGETN